MCSLLCTGRLRGLDITMFQFRVPPVILNDLLFYPSGHHWGVLLTGILQGFAEASDWHRKQSLCNRANLCLAVTYQVTQSFWFCKQKLQDVSWHCTFKRRKKKKPSTQKSPSTTPPALFCIICATINRIPQWKCLQCIPFITASSKSHKKCPLRPYFQSLDLKVLLILVACPLVPLESIPTPLGLRRLWILGSESKRLGTARNTIKLARWNLWVE